METKANTALIGASTLIVLALGFVFIYWLARGGEQSSNVPLTVVFEDPVTGLAVGSQVVFNGINIGAVKTLRLDPKRPKVVLANLSVQPLSLIKQDTQVTLGFQGLTGVGYVEMAGGSPDLPSIWEAMPDPTIVAARSSFQDLMAGARGILARTDSTLKTVESLVAENSDDIGQAIRDVRSFTGALSQNSDKIANMVDQIGTASAAIADATSRLNGIVQRSEQLVAAIDPEEVRGSLDNIARTTEVIAQQSGRLNAIVERADLISADLQGFSKHLPTLGERTEALVAAIDPAQISGTLTRIDEIADAIDPQGIRTAVEGISGVGEIFADNRENIDTIVTRLTALSGDLSAFAANLPAMGERTGALLAAIDAERLGRTLENIDHFTTTLAANRENIDAIIADARAVSSRFETVSTRAESLLTKLDSMAGSGTGGIMQDAQETLAAVRDAANAFNTQVTALGGGLGDFSDRGMREFRGLITEGQRTVSRLDRVISNIENNPSGFIFGGEKVPEFRGQQRR